MRLATGEEALIARVLTTEGKVGYGLSFRLDATEAWHMAERAAGVRSERPPYEASSTMPGNAPGFRTRKSSGNPSQRLRR
jgi:hypothetical protein